MAKMLGREAILQVDDLAQEVVEVPEWGGAVLVRGLTGSERDAFEQDIVQMRRNGKAMTTEIDMHNIRAKLCVRCMVDEDGERLFSDADMEALGRKSAQALQRVFDVAQRLSGLTSEDVEELAKN